MTMQSIILDTDVGSDCDDIMALALLIYGRREWQTHIAAITVSNSAPGSIGCIRAVFDSLGEYLPPIGAPTEGVPAFDKYARAIAERYGKEDGECESAVRVMRRALAYGSDVVIAAVGPLTNVAALIESEGDDISEKSGTQLLRENCKQIAIMGGKFDAPVPEWNIKLDIAAAKCVFEKAPCRITVIPHEAGEGAITGGFLLSSPDTPVSLAFKLFPGCDKLSGRHSWDPFTALFAAGFSGMFEYRLGTVTVDDDGKTHLECGNGMHSVAMPRLQDGEDLNAAKARIAAYIDTRVSSLFA
jgi:hypothetical protein